ncbi:PQQ-dependent sugar dehydrogenase [Paeniglutamicibacter cryotolerans]|uniref:Glucose/arabinose dehydrogenase n=2 Tax=Paeniglutamicibacter cryotolerans TaxID=670079 RepID=A0A839QES7_9MICC|nr:glucose/arabinose dehydrogenase [Paeniglutamicibacter cryotolerans]
MDMPFMESQGAGPARRTVLGFGSLVVGLGLLSACTPSAGPTPDPTAPSSDPATVPGPVITATLATGLDTPWSIAFLPGAEALVSERDTGAIRSIGPAGTPVVATVPGVVHGGEGGLLGLAPSPDFTSTGQLFIYYTAVDGNRVSRFAHSRAGLGPEQVLVSGIPSASIHNGGRIKFGPDGYLYIGTGDAGQQDAAQDIGSLGGKILRVDPDGAAAPGNPFGSLIFSFGHRNVQGLAWDASGRMWASELGPDRDDELNLITPGTNYGWPLVTGAQADVRFEPAAHVWPSTADASPSALAIDDGVAYVAALRGERLWTLPLPTRGRENAGGGTLSGSTEYFQGEYGRLRDVVRAPDSSLWIATNEGSSSRILRLVPGRG